LQALPQCFSASAQRTNAPRGALIATRTGTEAVIGTGLVHSTPTTVHVIELGAETGAIGKAAIRPSDDVRAAAHSAEDATAASTDDASHGHSWAHKVGEEVGQKALEEGIKSVGQPNQSRDDRKK
jgi:hypothetical protein